MCALVPLGHFMLRRCKGNLTMNLGLGLLKRVGPAGDNICPRWGKADLWDSIPHRRGGGG